MSASKIIGAALLALPFVCVFIFVGWQIGLRPVLIILAISAVFVTCINVGDRLLHGGPR